MENLSENEITSYTDAIKAIKQAILQSRYRVAVQANSEMLSLYFGIGEYISKNSRKGFWGTNAIAVVSEQLSKELPGLRGFSATNMKNMRLFYETWANEFRPMLLDKIINRQLPTDDLQRIDYQIFARHSQNRRLTTDDLVELFYQHFICVGFTHHIEIINKTKSREERIFYINNCATGFWSVAKLKYNLKSNLYHQQGAIINNFAQTISESDLTKKH
jgi:predicted nuclease of restriction endonuclease-like (RecB) superfamily